MKERFHKIVDALIALNKEMRPNEKEALQIPPGIHADRYCTVQIVCSRGSGKTSYINSRATQKDLIIVPFVFSKKWITHGIPCISATETIHTQALKGIKIHEKAVIYVDEARNVERKALDLLYRIFSNYKRTFVLLG